MKPGILILLAEFFLLLLFSGANAQNKSPNRFGDVTPADFDLSHAVFDTTAGAVVISDVGSSSIEGNNDDWFVLQYRRTKRIKILNPNGFRAATEEIYLYSDGSQEERLKELSAVTYNLENGKVVQLALDEASVFKEVLDENRIKKKFTLPAAKVGSIIEISYTIISDFLFRLRPWVFQGEFPKIRSEYQVEIPQFFYYVFLQRGYLPIENTRSTEYKTYNVMFRNTDFGAGGAKMVKFSGNMLKSKWFLNNVPALKEERFTSTLQNHVSRIDFQLSQYRYPNVPPHDVVSTWELVSESLLKNENFGLSLTRDNNWLNGELDKSITRTENTFEKAIKIFQYVRDHFTCTDHNGILASAPLKTIFNNKSGSVADLNLLLIAMLNHENVSAHPVIMSTRSNGLIYEDYPMLEKLNYVIAEVQIGDREYYVDASRPLGFGKLSTDCYNGWAWKISINPHAIYFRTDSLKEEKVTSIFLTKSAGGGLTGRYSSTLGYYESQDLRAEIKNEGLETYEKKLTSSQNEVKFGKVGIDSLDKLEDVVNLHYDFSLNRNEENILYFNPMFGEGYHENPFRATQRSYPVEMPYTTNRVYLLNMEIPEGYEIDELPKSTKVKLNEGDGYFEYTIGKNGTNRIQLITKVVLKKTNFLPGDYEGLRNFFAFIIAKQSEQIVFRKVK